MAKRLAKIRDVQQQKDTKPKLKNEPLESDPISDFSYAKSLLDSKEYAGAISLLGDILSDNPTHEAATLLLARAFDNAGTERPMVRPVGLWTRKPGIKKCPWGVPQRPPSPKTISLGPG